MIIRTKKYQIPTNTYIKMGFKNVFRNQWWASLIALGLIVGNIILNVSQIYSNIWIYIVSISLYLLYLLFWLIQFAGVTRLDQFKMLFEKLKYEISSHQILIKRNNKEGMPLRWEQIKRVFKGKKYFLLVLSKAHLIYLPHSIFNSNNEIKLMETILKNKKLIR